MLGKIIHEYSNFTFQSGSIQMNYWHFGFKWKCNFTFQSGSIQMQNYPYNYSCNDSLHSNLVLFKSEPAYTLKLFITVFTFQSGSIQMWTNGRECALFVNFTFQSGSIQIYLSCYRIAYIPTLHSNLVLFKSRRVFLNPVSFTFTFQSGSIQISSS